MIETPYQPKLLAFDVLGLTAHSYVFGIFRNNVLLIGKIEANSPSSQSKDSESLRKCWQPIGEIDII